VSQVYFTDRDLGKAVPNALAAAGYSVERHDDHFGPLTPDPVWIREIGRRGWIPFSHNKDIRYRTQERDMVMRAGVPLFVLIGNAPHRELALNLVQTMPPIIEFLGSHDVPFIAKVYRPSPVEAVHAGRPGKVSLWLDGAGWEEALEHGG
jgi:hypothetical protein